MDNQNELRRKVEIAQELELRRGDPLMLAYNQLTPPQKSFVHATQSTKAAKGGNRSGKTWSGIIDDLMQARGLHPTRQWKPFKPNDNWMGWYAAVSYELFGLQGWIHFRNLLLYPGESVLRLPTRNILAIGWHGKNPQVPDYMKVRRIDGGVGELWFKSYEQGVDTFQSGGVDLLHLDEEAPEDIVQECRMRIMERSGQLSFSATPLKGAPSLRKIEEEYTRQVEEKKTPTVFFVRLKTMDNPAMPSKAIDEIKAEFAHNPEMLKCRLEGIEMALQGLVYPDTVWTPDHVCDPFDIPDDWARYRWIDHGWRNCGCVWFAVSPNEDDLVCYRSYKGKERTIPENAAAINGLENGRRFIETGIDRATLASSGGKNPQGQVVRVIDLWTEALGCNVTPSPYHEILAGVAKVISLLKEKGGPNGDRPRMRIFRTCTELLEERRGYMHRDAREKGDEGPDNPVKRDDHCLDPFRYGIVHGLKYKEPPVLEDLPASKLGALFRAKREPKRKIIL